MSEDDLLEAAGFLPKDTYSTCMRKGAVYPQHTDAPLVIFMATVLTNFVINMQ
jgi:hypothetical protein